MSEWQPIDSAPRDGRFIIGLRPPGHWSPAFVGHLTELFRRPGYLINPYTGAAALCTHWMPLPPAPATDEPREILEAHVAKEVGHG